MIAKNCLEFLAVDQESSNAMLLGYAALYWPWHYEDAFGNDGRNDAQDVARKFLSNKISHGSRSEWSSYGREAIMSLSWRDDLYRKVVDTLFQPLETICAFGFTDLLNHYLNYEGWPPPSETMEYSLTLALKWGKRATACLLLEKAELSNVKFGLHRPFALAIGSSMGDVASAIVRQEANLHLGGDAAWTLLHWMVVFKHDSGTRYLLENGARINIKDRDGRVPLHFAAMNGYHDGLLLLLEKCDQVDIVDKSGWTPWHWAACMDRAAFVDRKESQSILADMSGDENGSVMRDSFLRQLVGGHLRDGDTKYNAEFCMLPILSGCKRYSLSLTVNNLLTSWHQ
jgi:hypothetical protein